MTAPNEQPQSNPAVEIPTPLNVTSAQIREIAAERGRDFSELPRLKRWPRGSDLIGPLLPGRMLTVGGRPSQGKTTVLVNMLDQLVEDRWPTLYLCTETRAVELRSVWAAMRLGYPKKRVLANEWHLLPAGARERFDEEMNWQEQRSDVALFIDLPLLDVDTLKAAIKKYALRYRYSIIILDHLHRFAVNDIKNTTAELGRVVRGIKGTAAQHGLVVILAAQINRAQERTPLAEVLPAPTSALKQTGAIEEESNVVLMLHRSRRRDATVGMVKEVVMGQREVADLIEPGIMCASVGKNRDCPEAVGRMLRFRVDNDRLFEDDWQADQLSLGKREREPGEEGDGVPF